MSSCTDTFGTDPLVKKVPIDPKDTTTTDSKLKAKTLFWRFKEVAGSQQVTEWPNSITYINNSAMIDSIGGKVFVWINLEMKANFSINANDKENPERADRVEYLKIKIDSLEILPNLSYSLNNLQHGRYSRIELYSYAENKKFSFEGSDLISRIKFDYNYAENKLSGNFVFDFQMISYIKTLQFLGNFSIYF
jgi:hypothetical protein